MKKSAKIITGVITVGVLAALVVPRFLKPKEEAEPVPPPTVDIIQPSLGDIELFRGVTGKVEPADMIYVTPKLAGELKSVSVSAGDYVTEGQVLCVIDNKQIESAKITLDTTAVSLEDARTNLARMQVLYASGDISAQSYEQLVSSVKMAELQYESAKLNYDTQVEYSTITAPISGRVESSDIEVHDMVSQQSVICVISGEGDKSVSFYVTENIVQNMKVGDLIQIEKNGSDYSGTIIEVSSMIDASTGLFKVKASLEGADALATGTVVKLYVTSDKVSQVLTLPADTIYYNGGDAYVFTFDDGTVHKAPVEVGISDSEKVEILSGVDAQSQVITTWSPELYEGAPAVLNIPAQE